MVFWVVSGAIVLIAVALVMLSAFRARAEAEPPAAYDLRVYRDQLREIERDVARGVLAEQDAERVRIEVSRRILAADTALQNAQNPSQSGQTGLGVLWVCSGLVIAGTFAIYLDQGTPGYGDLALSDRIALAEALQAERPSQAEAEDAAPSNPVAEGAEFETLVGQLRGALAERPDDLRGHRLLVSSEARLGNFKAARAVQERVIELSGGEDAPLQVWTDYADLLVLAAGGYVSPEAEAVAETILARDSQNGVARYYWGLMQLQTGRPDRAFRVWDALLRAGPEDAPWISPVLAQIEDVARDAGVRYQLPVIGSGRGPSNEDIEAAESMSPAERIQMIQGMVSGLAERLASEGGPPDDWAQLITALGVLGRFDQAVVVFENAKRVYGEDPGAMDVINGAADRAGIL